jgi:hypothetical protein
MAEMMSKINKAIESMKWDLITLIFGINEYLR